MEQHPHAPSIPIGPAGSDGRGNLKGIAEVARLGLDCMEVEFTYGVRMQPEMAEAVGSLADKHGIALSVHAPYYINLAAYEEDKIAASRQRILDSCHRAHLMGARNVVFHAGFYQKRSPRETYRLIRDQVRELQQQIRRTAWKVVLCPEITGKPSQFGSTEELQELMADTGCALTVDFAHLYARQQGIIDYDALMPALPHTFHAHFSGIEYTPKGEKKHIRLQPADFEPLLEALARHRKRTTIICESPKPFEDAVMMKEMVKQLKPVGSNRLV
jgi:deoxyribonuclease-4